MDVSHKVIIQLFKVVLLIKIIVFFFCQTLSSGSMYWIKLLILSNLYSCTLGQSIQLIHSHYVWLNVLCRHWMFLLPGADILKYGMVFLFSYCIFWYDTYFSCWVPQNLHTHLKEVILVFSTGGEFSTGRIYTVLCEKSIDSAWKWDVQHLKGGWQLLDTYILLFSLSWLNNYFIMPFVVQPFHIQSQKETYIISLFPHPSLIYWLLSYLCLLTKIEDIGKVTLSHTKTSLFHF